MAASQLDILYEDNHLLVLNKPAGLPTMGVAPELPSLVRVAKDYLRLKYDKPGNVYLGVVSRLDSVASGVTIFARTSKAAARLSEQFRSRAVRKIYWAIVTGSLKPPAGGWIDWLAKDEAQHRMQIVSRNTKGAQEARLAYQTLQILGGDALVEIELETGRKHQIRLQLASHGCPVVGDRKYGSRALFVRGVSDVRNQNQAIALHARRLTISHPVRGEKLEFAAPVARSWRAWGISEERSP